MVLKKMYQLYFKDRLIELDKDKNKLLNKMYFWCKQKTINIKTHPMTGLQCETHSCYKKDFKIEEVTF